MSGRLVKYSGDIKAKIDAYNSLEPMEKKGSYWDKTDDSELTIAKKHIKDHYILIQDYTCPYCRQRNEVDHNAVWDTEHIIPKDQYPQFMFSPLNLCVACKDCNQSKTNKNVLKNPQRKTLPTKSEDYIFVHPNLDEYKNHIKILKSSLFFIPLDSKGKETIEICGLLRFLYRFTDYGNISLEVKNKIGLLHKELMDAKTSIEEHFILSCIEDVVQRGKEIAKANHLEAMSS
ncbi:HNH endonuclease [Shewanella algae]|uniref:HNH endonuclease n=1 Tax=Shewanella algae TaxID=38313 RepID=UPI001AAE2748|nr:HNH endonuclease signature motif containing protein [Shewanella algae]MBO2583261.1 HNH endonuclease [Shewanella algae]